MLDGKGSSPSEYGRLVDGVLPGYSQLPGSMKGVSYYGSTTSGVSELVLAYIGNYTLIFLIYKNLDILIH